jgi:hypothetical protein
VRLAHDSSSRKRAHLRDPGLLQRPRARFQRRAGRAHIVDHHDNRAGECGGRAGGRERLAHVAMPTARGQAGLGRGGAHAAQRRHHRNPHVAREIRGLVEAAVPAARCVQRHRNGAGRAGEHVATALAHQPAERPGKRSPSLVLQGVDDGAQRAVVGANRPRAIDQPAPASAARAAGERDADQPPRRQRVAAAVAQRRREREDRRPAGAADRAAGRGEERLVAGGAGG